MKNVQSSIFIILGTVLLIVALSVVLHNVNESLNGDKMSSNALAQIKSQIPELSYANDIPNVTAQVPSVEDEIINQYGTVPTPTDENVTDETMYIDGETYIGIVSIPSLGLELPILNELTNEGLKKAPCKYDGSIKAMNLIIGGHNYRSHFGRLKELNTGDEIYIVDVNGVVYEYEVIQSEVVNGYDVNTMKSGADGWDLTLFTCTLSGQSRVTIRAVRV